MVANLEALASGMNEEIKRQSAVLDAYVRRIAELEAFAREAVDIAETNKIPDRHGKRISSCPTTCLDEIATMARKILCMGHTA